MSTYAVTTSGASLAFDTNFPSRQSCFQMDENHVIDFYREVDSDGFVRVFEINTSTYAVTAKTRLEFDTQSNSSNSCFAIDSGHVINFWQGVDGDGFTQVFTVSTSAWTVATAAARLEFDTVSDNHNSCYEIDENHFINFWGGADTDGFVQVFEVNTSTWAVTTANSKLEFDTQSNAYNSCFVVDDNHFINFWQGFGDDGFVQIFEVNTTTWAVTTAGAPLEFDTAFVRYNSCYGIDGNHFIAFYTDVDFDGITQTFEVNTSTWAVTTASARFEFDTTNSGENSCYGVNDNHFVNFWRGADNDGFTQVFEVNTSTWAVTTTASWLEFDTAQGGDFATCKIDYNHCMNFWNGASDYGYAQVFTIDAPLPPDPPTVTTQAVDDIAHITATANGNITVEGTATPTKRGFVYDTSSQADPGSTAPADSDYASYAEDEGSYSTGAFDKGLTGLAGGETYYVRAYAYSTEGYNYGAEVSFTTLIGISGTVTLSASGVSGAVVRVIRQSTDTEVAKDTTDVDGNYSFDGLVVAAKYHICVEYTDGGSDKYNAKSLWDVVPG